MSEQRFRTAAEVATRCLVLCSLVAASKKENTAAIVSWLKAEGLWNDVSPKERSFLESKRPTKRQLIDASWRIEALYLLLWALQLAPSIEDSKTRADLTLAKSVLPFLGATAEFVANSQLKPEAEILDAHESIYQAHASVRDAELSGTAPEQDFDPGVVMECHHAINWLMGYSGQAWDDVTTDT